MCGPFKRALRFDDGFRGASVPVLLFITRRTFKGGWEDWRSNWPLARSNAGQYEDDEKLTDTVTYALPGGFLERSRDGVCRRRRLYETRAKH